MQHYKITASFEEFFFHLKSNIERKDKQKVCVLHTAAEGSQEIYFSSQDEGIIGLMKEKFNLEPCGSPLNLLKEYPDTWMARGNPEILTM